MARYTPGPAPRFSLARQSREHHLIGDPCLVDLRPRRLPRTLGAGVRFEGSYRMDDTALSGLSLCCNDSNVVISLLPLLHASSAFLDSSRTRFSSRKAAPSLFFWKGKRVSSMLDESSLGMISIPEHCNAQTKGKGDVSLMRRNGVMARIFGRDGDCSPQRRAEPLRR